MDEHHHWLVLHDRTEDAVLFDPNGPLRGEPYLGPKRGRSSDYDGGGGFAYEWGGHVENLVYDPDDDLDEVADDLYPGLREAVRAVVSDL